VRRAVPLKPLIIVLGPTGSGKSSAALAIAETFSGEVVNADSVQLYRGFDIGTAKLPLSERRGIPHHLLDVLDPSETCTAGAYSRLARAVIEDISVRGHVPVVTGGTGFYVKALVEGLFPGPERDIGLRASLEAREQRRPGFMHRALRRLDPLASRRIHPNDRNKTMRALEVCVLARRPMTHLLARQADDPLAGYAALKIVLNPARDALHRKLDERSELIFSGGLIKETRALIASGVTACAKPFESIGYKQALAFIRGEMTREQAIEEMKRDTRRYAKRQMTWLRREPDAVWVSGFGTDETVIRSLLNIVAEYLQTP
jgi:tRNA dimethylallyltransferase